MAQWRTQGCKREDWSMFTWNQTHRNLLMILPSSFLSTHWFIVQTIDFIHGSGGVLWQVVSVVWALIRWFRGLSTLTGLDLQTHLRQVTHYISSVQIHFSALVRKWLTDCHSKCSDLGFANCFFQFMVLKQLSAVNKFWNISKTFGGANRSHCSWRGIRG